jgi:hypothetical protein
MYLQCSSSVTESTAMLTHNLVSDSVLRQISPTHFVTTFILNMHFKSRGSAVGIATGYGLDDRGIGVRILVRSRIISSPYRPDRLWGPPNLVSNGYQGLFTPEIKR